jgi:hypothetical protein
VDDEPYAPEPTAPTAPSPAVAPEPGRAPSPAVAPSPARYAYLVGRLRGRQLTMEEATELFELQQQMLFRLRAAAAMPPPPTPPGTRGPAPRAPSVEGARPSALANEDLLWEGLPVLAAAAGVLAAVLKRSQELGAASAPLPSPPPSSRRNR